MAEAAEKQEFEVLSGEEATEEITTTPPPETVEGQTEETQLDETKPTEEKPKVVFNDEQQAFLEKTVGVRSGQIRDQESLRFNELQEKFDFQATQNELLTKQRDDAIASHGALSDEVGKDEFTEIDEGLRTKIEIPEPAQQSNNVFTILGGGNYSQQSLQEYQVITQSLGVKAMDHYEGNQSKIGLLNGKYELLSAQGKIPADFLAAIDPLDNSIEVLERALNDEVFRNQVMLAGYTARETKNITGFNDRVKELAGDLTPIPQTVNNPKSKPQTEGEVGRIEGSTNESDDFVPHVIDFDAMDKKV